MDIKDAKFITSAAREEQFLKPDKPMIAVCGKSNSGKSTLINMLANKKGLAKTSSAPGRTRLVNYFDFGAFLLADLPGYGYAAVSKEEQAKWAKTLDAFFARKEEISHVFVLSDIRRDPSADDMQMLAFLNYHILPFTLLATKADKLSRMKQRERARKVAQSAGLGEDNIIAVSSLTGEGKDKLLKKIEGILSL
ncbi:MAG: YihA family ribosome biogenesis GTP-binding protein [Clostridia bacterium]|nr:YihA family ribosome biogenesis GTP-binding protein [Clostridia bacterium]